MQCSPRVPSVHCIPGGMQCSKSYAVLRGIMGGMQCGMQCAHRGACAKSESSKKLTSGYWYSFEHHCHGHHCDKRFRIRNSNSKFKIQKFEFCTPNQLQFDAVVKNDMFKFKLKFKFTVGSMQCTVGSMQCTVGSMQCTVGTSMQCTVGTSMQCTLGSMQCTHCGNQQLARQSAAH